jgi:hypothetical protein
VGGGADARLFECWIAAAEPNFASSRHSGLAPTHCHGNSRCGAPSMRDVIFESSLSRAFTHAPQRVGVHISASPTSSIPRRNGGYSALGGEQ